MIKVNGAQSEITGVEVYLDNQGTCVGIVKIDGTYRDGVVNIGGDVI